MPVHVFNVVSVVSIYVQDWPFGIGKTNAETSPREDYLSYFQHFLVTCTSLPGVGTQISSALLVLL